jgi:replication-associated recombination protein RarA
MAIILTEQYRPTRVADFIGLDKVKEEMECLIADPVSSAWLFKGHSGSGKTSLAMAVCNELDAELHLIPSQTCTVDAVASIRQKTKHLPMFGKRFHLFLIDEADSMSNAAQDAFLSLLDSTGRPTDTIIIFTCNDDDNLKPRFKSRCFCVDFTMHGYSNETTALLERVWNIEAPAGSDTPDFARIVKDAAKNVRTALNELERKIKVARLRASRV